MRIHWCIIYRDMIEQIRLIISKWVKSIVDAIVAAFVAAFKKGADTSTQVGNEVIVPDGPTPIPPVLDTGVGSIGPKPDDPVVPVAPTEGGIILQKK